MKTNILKGSISILLGLVFLFSAYIKLFPIELFEFSFIEIKLANWTTAPYIARLFLSLEFLLGILLIFNFNGGNKKLAKFSFALLFIFTIYLSLIILFQGNNGNCGCFGTFIKMTPLESIIKNLLLMSLNGLLFIPPFKKNLSFNKLIIIAAGIASLLSPFILNPVNESAPPSENEINYNLKLDALYLSSKKDTPKVDLRKGKRVIAFLSLTCEHCKIGAQKLNLIHQNHPEIPIFFILNGDSKDLKPFLIESKTKTIQFAFMTIKEGFIENAGINFPAILWVNNSKVENRTKYTQLDESALIKWFEH
jgi:hypothetical protein